MSKEKTIELRDYQTELLIEVMERKSSILFLPTGSGKTFIASRLMKSMQNQLTIPVSEGGKRSYFLVNTVQLVEQQQKVLFHEGFTVVPLSGEIGVDCFTHEIWSTLEDYTEVFVMTSQIYLNCLNHGFLKLENANLIILDECHHASKKHPMAQILNFIAQYEYEKRPKVLGLTATLLNATVKNIDIAIKELETTFMGEVITSKKCKLIRDMYSTKPNIVVEDMKILVVSTALTQMIHIECEKAFKYVQSVELRNDITVIEIDEIVLNVPGENKKKLMTGALKDIEIHLKEYGPYFAYVVCRLYLVQLYRYSFTVIEEVYKNLIDYTISVIKLISIIIQNEITKTGPVEDISTIEKTSTEKIKFLFSLLEHHRGEDRALIFVERKMTSKALYNILKMFCESDPRGTAIKPDFIVGTDTNPLRNTREGSFKTKKKKEVITNFKRGCTNVLVATNILEEGIDIQSCNTVIMFDVFKTFRSYIQSKGRARMKGSKYIILNETGFKIFARLRDYDQLDQELDRVVDVKNISADCGNDDDGDDDTEFYSTDGGRMDCVGAVSLIHRYCDFLPQDVFSDLRPIWSYSKSRNQCRLRLPTNAAIRSDIKGPVKKNVKSAKRATALLAVRMLHECGALNDHLEPIKIPSAVQNRTLWFPNWEESPSNKKDANGKEIYESTMRVPKFLLDARPIADEKMYLHVITTEPNYEPNKNIHRVYCCAELMKSEYNFGILTRNRLPSVCEFPVYSDIGEIVVKIKCNDQVLRLSTKQVETISQFHRNFIINIIRPKKCFVYDVSGSANGYFIVPLKPNKMDSSRNELVWSIIEKKINSTVIKPSDQEIQDSEFTEKNYLFKVVSPWYKITKKVEYAIVVDVSSEIHLQSEFVTPHYKTFGHYFESVYNVTATRPGQPMLEVRTITNNLDGVTPRALTASQRTYKHSGKVKPIYFAPEFCVLFDFPSFYWYKSIILPSILHRFNYLLLAEELRQKIVQEAGVGVKEPPTDEDDTVEFFRMKETRDKNTKAEEKKERKVGNKPRKVKFMDKGHEEEDIVDIERSLEINLPNIKRYAEYIDTPLRPITKSRLASEGGQSIVPINTRTEMYKLSLDKPPRLHTLKKYDKVYGPKTYQVLETLTTRRAQDAFSLERLETLGDSYLKFVATIFTYIKCPEMNEGLLTMMKSELVSNKYLFCCAKKLGIPSYINDTRFSGRDSWCPPSFTIPRCFKKQKDSINPISSLLAIDIPVNEQFSGFLSDDTVEVCLNTVKKYISDLETKESIGERKMIMSYLGIQELSLKTGSDVVEALLGLYLQTCGMSATFDLLKFFGILTHVNYSDIYDQNNFPNPNFSGAKINIDVCLPNYKNIETMIGYQFINQSYLIQAFTHPSDLGIAVTDCYQKLEFVGDAVLDFLITSYIFEYCGQFSPGQLTDLRSALVNNNTFGALAVRLGLHKYLRHNSKTLEDAMNVFIIYQEERNHVIHGNELIKLINEFDTRVAEEVEVPKALGDIFESMAGAIYLDSGCNLEVVWKIYYNIMKDEIAKFSEKIPINPVRALYEHLIKPKFLNSINDGQNPNYKCVTLSAKGRTFIGKGPNIYSAKRAAAKLALKALNYNDFVI